MEENVKNEESKRRGLWELVRVVLISVLIVLPIRTYIAQPFIVSGDSMLPNFHNGEYLIIDELTYQFREPKRGEVVVFRFPLNASDFFIKRIIGLSGETIEIKNGQLSVNGTILPEDYLPKNIETAPEVRITLGQNQYFVLGDNREHSSDSRSWGALEKSKIMGRALLRLWPVAKAGMVGY